MITHLYNMFITHIEVDFPTFGIKDTFYFPKHFIEMDNGKWKTTAFNIIISMFTGKFCNMNKYPEWSAIVHFINDEVARLMDGVWYLPQFLIDINNGPLLTMDPTLAQFIRVGDFFKWMSTPEQRREITKLLWVDEEWFMKGLIPDYHPNLSRDLKAELKASQWKEEIILSDIEKYQAQVIAFQKKYSPETIDAILQEDVSTQSSINTYQEYIDKYHAECNEHMVHIIKQRQLAEKVVEACVWRLKLIQDINSCKSEIELMRSDYNKERLCPTCNTKLSVTDSNKVLVDQAGKMKKQIEILENDLVSIEHQLMRVGTVVIPEQLPSLTTKEICERYWVAYVSDTWASNQWLIAFKEELSSYNFALNLVTDKSEQLKQIDSISLEIRIKDIENAKKKYTEHLELQLKAMPRLPWVEIELFKYLKNGKMEETFNMTLNGKPLAELSNGQSQYCYYSIALLFATILNIPYVLFDEAGTLSQDTYKNITSIKSDKQTIFARATTFNV